MAARLLESIEVDTVNIISYPGTVLISYTYGQEIELTCEEDLTELVEDAVLSLEYTQNLSGDSVSSLKLSLPLGYSVNIVQCDEVVIQFNLP